MSNDVTYLFDTETGDLSSIDSIKRHDLLAKVEETGMLGPSAAEVGLTLDMIADAIANDPRLETDIALAQGRYQASVLRRMRELAFEGSEKAIVGGKNKDEILGSDKIPNDTALKLIAQLQFGDELAIVTRQRLTAEVKTASKDQVSADFSLLPRKERRELEAIFKKAHDLTQKRDDKVIEQGAKLVEKEDEKNGE